MKTAISLPDELFQAADSHAKRQHMSRSQLYAEAIHEYLTRHVPDEVTTAMNEALDQLGERAPKSEAFVAAAARQVLLHAEW